MVMMCPNTSGNLTIVNHPFGNGKHTTYLWGDSWEKIPSGYPY
jgi:hypothetical protein